MSPPHRRDPVLQRQQAVGVGRHILHGEVIVDKGPGQAQKRQQQQQELLALMEVTSWAASNLYMELKMKFDQKRQYQST